MCLPWVCMTYHFPGSFVDSMLRFLSLWRESFSNGIPIIYGTCLWHASLANCGKNLWLQFLKLRVIHWSLSFLMIALPAYTFVFHRSLICWSCIWHISRWSTVHHLSIYCITLLVERTSTCARNGSESDFACCNVLHHSLLVSAVAASASILSNRRWYPSSTALDQYPVLNPLSAHTSFVGHHDVIDAYVSFSPVVTGQ